MSTNTSYELLLVSVAGDWPTRVSALATTQHTLHQPLQRLLRVIGLQEGWPMSEVFQS